MFDLLALSLLSSDVKDRDQPQTDVTKFRQHLIIQTLLIFQKDYNKPVSSSPATYQLFLDTGWLRNGEQLAREPEEVRARQGVEEEAVSLASLGAEVEELVGSEEDGELAG